MKFDRAATEVIRKLNDRYLAKLQAKSQGLSEIKIEPKESITTDSTATR